MRIIINGIGGFMGGEVVRAAQQGYGNSELVGGIDLMGAPGVPVPCAQTLAQAEALFPVGSADCLVDFSHHACTAELLKFAVKTNLPAVIATTGHTSEELAAIQQAACQIPVFHSANMSVGVALLVKLAKIAAAAMPDAEIEIIEKHHNRKLDAPSGTAMMLYRELSTVRQGAAANCGRSGHAKRTADEIGIHSIRMGNIVGEHEVIIGTATQSISLKHEAFDRALFAQGALVAAGYLKDRQPGLYDMHDLLQE